MSLIVESVRFGGGNNRRFTRTLFVAVVLNNIRDIIPSPIIFEVETDSVNDIPSTVQKFGIIPIDLIPHLTENWEHIKDWEGVFDEYGCAPLYDPHIAYVNFIKVATSSSDAPLYAAVSISIFKTSATRLIGISSICP